MWLVDIDTQTCQTTLREATDSEEDWQDCFPTKREAKQHYLKIWKQQLSCEANNLAEMLDDLKYTNDEVIKLRKIVKNVRKIHA